ncbi:MAG: glycoside hydrolase family 95 protein [Bacteroidales bacterium]|jgi:alpha-L-fucosidase 2|nr:glycoside hydrolase family 95 protein [Bacteroidales bacterium]
MKTMRLLLWLALMLTGCQADYPAGIQGLYLASDQSADTWEERFPLGNGRLGAMPDGGVAAENIILNEISLWSGSPAEDLRQGTHRVLPLIRELLYKERTPQAQELMFRFFKAQKAGSYGSAGAENTFGSYQVLGSAVFDFSYSSFAAEARDYNRMLDISTATAFTSFELDGITYTRECFTSLENDVLVMHLAASVPHALTFRSTFTRPERARVFTSDNSLIMEGTLSSGAADVQGMRFYTRMDVIPSGGGRLSFVQDSIILTGATEATVIISASTDYQVQTMSLSRDSSFIRHSDSLAFRARGQSFPELKKNHVDRYQSLFHRVHLQLPDSAAFFFQYGRYLLISSTREGLLPPNLQGLWTPYVQTPRNGAYDMNMHLQMNLWPALKTNLSELHLPLLDFTARLSDKGRATAREYYNAPGWVVHSITNLWGYTAPGHVTAWEAYYAGGAWMCSHFWEHYRYTMNAGLLRKQYPVMKEAALFYLSTLMEEPRQGWWVPAPSMSYGNMYYLVDDNSPDKLSVPLFLCMGSAADVQTVRELFSNVISANKILMNTDDFPLVNKLEEALDRLPPDKISASGALLRWLYDYPEEDVRLRNIPHLYALYPGSEMAHKDTSLLEACRTTLERMGNGGSGWQMAWNINLLARLGDGTEAARILRKMMSPALKESPSPYLSQGMGTVTLLGPGMYPNGFSSNPPFQIDGNLGACAGIAEMLLQSHQGFIEVLPAIAPEWEPSGSFSGLCARGGATVSCTWKDGKVREITLCATAGNTFLLKVPENFNRIKKTYVSITLNQGEQITLHSRSKL